MNRNEKTLMEDIEITTRKKDKDGNFIKKIIRKMTGTRIRCEVCGTPLKRTRGQIVRFCSRKCKGTLNKNGRRAIAKEKVRQDQKRKREEAKERNEKANNDHTADQSM